MPASGPCAGGSPEATLRGGEAHELLPKHDVMGAWTRALEAGSIAAAVALVALNAARFAAEPRLLAWWLPLVLAAGALAADFASGIVHWTADTWGRESLPVFGIRFLRPFRIHHVNPDDLVRARLHRLQRRRGAARLPAAARRRGWSRSSRSCSGRPACFTAAFGAVSLPTNQVHQWAHHAAARRASSPGCSGAAVILSRAAARGPPRAPYTTRYCIATGWCNSRARGARLLPGARARDLGAHRAAPARRREARVKTALRAAGCVSRSPRSRSARRSRSCS